MKKIIIFIIAAVCSVMTVFAENANVTQVIKDVNEGIKTTHQDVKEIVSTVHQDGKDVISTIYEDGKEAAKELYPGIKKTVIEIGKAIGVAAEHVYIVLVKKYIVDGIVQAMPFLLGIIIIIIGWVKIGKYIKVNVNSKPTWHILYPITLILVGIIVLCCVDYNVMVMGLVNPEYGAINYILEYSKQIIQ